MGATMEWRSDRRIFVEKHQIRADWAHKADAKYRVAFMNRCLCLYYQALENIEKIERKDFDHGWKMRKQLDKLASIGWEVRGPGDLNSALEHLARYRVWKDSETDRYKGGPGKIFSRKLDAPEAFARFADALDERLAQLAADLRGYISASEAATVDADKNSWEGCQKNLNRITGVLGKVEDSLWLMDTVELVKHQATKDFFAKTSKVLGKYGGPPGKFIDIMGRIDSVAKVKIGVKAATMGTGVSAQASDALAAMRATVDFLPILGNFYGAALDAAPALIESFKASLELKLRKATRAYKGLPLSTGPTSECAICLMPSAKHCKR